ncbi:MAG: two-component system response regulator [Microbacterium sp. SCN 70-200]|uniref:response regulator transcription factor n=1 Tax=unclassified Microbacterium TaxID=2609290 RepID=UPI00086C14A0|nr:MULTISPECIES: response regulator transcription factor [unclassified Microbacterium]MBN9215304.1 response regulator transcription factor [Microbacterium sp.]ODT42705.1 MAG: two-component system response regulator [Microbacterium sp. SCN 70-200]OJV79952.1 MAG: two-component system response regulator [Microbacterium sp. 70-16]
MIDARPRLLLAEDDPQLGPLMVRVLDEVYDVTLLADGAAALDAALEAYFDVLIIDRRLPGIDGVSIVETLRRSGVTTPTLILTALGTVQDKVRGLDAGANDYLVKPFEFDELFARLRAIRRVSDGEGPFVRLGPWEFYPDSRTVYSPYDGRTILTERESDLLKLFVTHPQTTFARSEILRAVFEATDTPGTVDTYVHYLRRKTDPDIVTTVRGRGYRLGML